MKSIRILPLAIVLASTCAIGQDAFLHHADMGRCPIGLQVNHGSFFFEKKVNEQPLTNSVQRIHLTITNPDPRAILKLQLTVRGYSDKGRSLRLLRASSAPDLYKEITVVLDIPANGHATTDLSLNNFTAITSVDLNSLNYADGSAWNAPARGACSVAPSPMMLVSADRQP